MDTLITKESSGYSTGNTLPLTFTTILDSAETSSQPDQPGSTATITTLGILFIVSCMVIIYMCFSRRNRCCRSQSPSTILIQHIDDLHDATSLSPSQGKKLNDTHLSVRNPLAVAMSAVTPHLMEEVNRSPKVLKENAGYGRTFNHSLKDTRRISRSLETLCNPLYDGSDGGFWINCRMSDDDIQISFKKKRESQSTSDRSKSFRDNSLNPSSRSYPMGSNSLWRNPLCRSDPSLSRKLSPEGMRGVSSQNYEVMTSPHQSLHGMPSLHAISNTYSVPCQPDGDGKSRVWPSEQNLYKDQGKEPRRHIPIELDGIPEGEEIEAPASSMDKTEKTPAILFSSIIQEEDNAQVKSTILDMATRPLPPIPQQGIDRSSYPPFSPQGARKQLPGTSLPPRDASSMKSIASQKHVRFEEGC